MEFLFVKSRLKIPLSEIEMNAIRAQGPGGQNVNKVSSAIHLRFDIKNASTLLSGQKDRILAFRDKRITADGVIVIKAQNHRTQDRNREEALSRLKALLLKALHIEPYRRPTRPTSGSTKRRLKQKAVRSDIKAKRGRVRSTDLD